MDESEKNIMQALLEASDVIKTYVAAIKAGNPIPYTILIADETAQRNERIVKALEDLLDNEEPFLNNSHRDWMAEIHHLIKHRPLPVWALEEWPDLIKKEDTPGEIEFEVVMLKDGKVVDGSRQVITSEEKMETLKNYAKFKGYEISFFEVKK